MALAARIDILLGAKIAGLQKGMRHGGAAVKTFSAQVKAAGAQILTYAAATTALYGAFRAVSGAFRSATEFNQAMASSTAIMGDLNAKTQAALRWQARAASYGTKFSSKEAAEAYYYLASAGFTAEQSLKSLGAVVRFAQAGMFDLKIATDLATDAQSALGLTVKDAEQNQRNLVHVTDVLVKANTLANASVEQFSRALTSKAGAAAKILGMGIEEIVSLLAVLADQGIKGEAAGVAASRILVGLKTNAISNAAAFENLKIRIYDANNEFRNLGDILDDLERSLGGMSDKEKQAAIMSMGFTKRTADVIAMLFGASDKLRGFNRELDKSAGITEEVSKKQLPEFVQAMDKVWAILKDVSQITLGPMLENVGRNINASLVPYEQIASGFYRMSQKAQGLNETLRDGSDAAKAMAQSLESLGAAASGAKEKYDKLKHSLYEKITGSAADFMEKRQKGIEPLLEAEAEMRKKIATQGMDSQQVQRWELINEKGIPENWLGRLDKLYAKYDRLTKPAEALAKIWDWISGATARAANWFDTAREKMETFRREQIALQNPALIQGSQAAFHAEQVFRAEQRSGVVNRAPVQDKQLDALESIDDRIGKFVEWLRQHTPKAAPIGK